jgi:hypothetical protein
VLTTAAGTAPSYIINGAIFNKNTTAIKVESNTNSMSGNSIKNTIITCRYLPAPTSAANFATHFSTIKTALAANTATSLAPYVRVNTLGGVRSGTGVKFSGLSNNSTYPKVGDAASSGNLNIFDNLDYGVHLTSSRADIKNTTFQNMAGAQPVFVPFGPAVFPYGVAVYAPIQTTQLYNQLITGGAATNERNFFYDCFRAIEINNYLEVFVTNNIFTCSSTPVLVSGNTIASHGVFLKNIKERIEMYTNYLTNWTSGVVISRNTAGGGTNNPIIEIDANSFSANSAGFCTNAILMSDVSGNTITSGTPVIRITASMM